MDTLTQLDVDPSQTEQVCRRVGRVLTVAAVFAFTIVVAVSLLAGPYSDARSTLEMVVIVLGGLLTALALLQVTVVVVTIVASALRERR
ncbi:hypothetical protein [Lentzea sp. E54]|uniref:hypothetical protein n=1 Tax=Lentzea xerophila TaxID=3435883 RepID=UPI003DA4A96D